MKANLNLLLFTLVQTIAINSFAQSMLVNSNGGTPHASAIMELRSSDKGFLGPRMSESQRLAISSPAEGLLVYQNDGLKAFYFYNGSAWDTLGGATTISNVTNVSESGFAVLRDIKASGVNGGDFYSGAWRIRDLNDLDGDLSFISSSGNEFTLDTGVYSILIIAPAHEVKLHQCRLWNVTDSLVSANGNVAHADKASTSNIIAIIKVSSSSTTFRIEHRSEEDRTNIGFGEGVTWGENTYTQVRIEKL